MIAFWRALASAVQFDGQGDHRTTKSYVRQAFRMYSECGIFCYGFARARRYDCGYDYFVAYSCKGRGVCTSCTMRRMMEGAHWATRNRALVAIGLRCDAGLRFIPIL